ncbi:MAG: response regulator [Parcubacteria group bacterium]|nr:response regulator [Parcubacteria group bacterium]
MENVKTILVVEDEKALNSIIVERLKEKGFKTFSAFTAEEAMNSLKTEKIDLIWLDLRLPKMSGFDFLKKLRGEPELKDKKVVVVSVSGTFDTKDEVKKLSVLEYFVKSEWKLDNLINEVSMLMDKGKA